MITAEVTKTDIDRIFRKLKNIDPRNRSSLLHRGFQQATADVERQLKLNASGRYLKVRSGHLRNSIQSKVIRDTGELRSVVGSNVRSGRRLPYASIHEEGGTIRPKRAQWLAVPLPSALTPSGVLRKKPTEWDNTFFRKSKAGNLILFQKQGKKIVPLFIMKKRVTVPASKYMSRTIREMKSRILNIISNTIERALR